MKMVRMTITMIPTTMGTEADLLAVSGAPAQSMAGPRVACPR